jgi:hypothetical protein
MGLLELIVLLVVVGFALWLIQLLPIDATIKRIIVAVVVLIVILTVLKLLFGLDLPSL